MICVDKVIVFSKKDDGLGVLDIYYTDSCVPASLEVHNSASFSLSLPNDATIVYLKSKGVWQRKD